MSEKSGRSLIALMRKHEQLNAYCRIEKSEYVSDDRLIESAKINLAKEFSKKIIDKASICDDQIAMIYLYFFCYVLTAKELNELLTEAYCIGFQDSIFGNRYF